MASESTVDVESLCDGCGHAEYNTQPEDETPGNIWTEQKHCDICSDKTKHLNEIVD